MPSRSPTSRSSPTRSASRTRSCAKRPGWCRKSPPSCPTSASAGRAERRRRPSSPSHAARSPDRVRSRLARRFMTDPMTRPQPVLEATIEPGLPICDPHHHLWDRMGSRYVLDELLSDLEQGHNVVSTVFVECMSEYRKTGPEALRPVGETDFVERIASDAERRGPQTPRVAAGIISYADLTLGA